MPPFLHPLHPGALAAKSHLDVISIPSLTHSSHPVQSDPRGSGKACSWPKFPPPPPRPVPPGSGTVTREQNKGVIPHQTPAPNLPAPRGVCAGPGGPACCPRRSLPPTRPWLYLQQTACLEAPPHRPCRPSTSLLPRKRSGALGPPRVRANQVNLTNVHW